jgi:hypothetical protein
VSCFSDMGFHVGFEYKIELANMTNPNALKIIIIHGKCIEKTLDIKSRYIFSRGFHDYNF